MPSAIPAVPLPCTETLKESTCPKCGEHLYWLFHSDALLPCWLAECCNRLYTARPHTVTVEILEGAKRGRAV